MGLEAWCCVEERGMLYEPMSRTVPIAEQARAQRPGCSRLMPAWPRRWPQAIRRAVTGPGEDRGADLRNISVSPRPCASATRGPRDRHTAGRKPVKPLRELALDALDDLGVPAAPALIADLTAALTGIGLRRRASPACGATRKTQPAATSPRGPPGSSRPSTPAS